MSASVVSRDAALLGAAPEVSTPLERPVFSFSGFMIIHRGMYISRESAGRLLALFVADGEWAEPLITQLSQAIEKHDRYWKEKAA